ncbi:uncharacterized protein HKW66_Vig0080520 [Vigna angularis]|uniref:Uncharacterized protein n=1 Tax=Phaseolus angularis TaxID=3914 RepID=A0A8T0KID3_PHAAN|nr:uncharacterized protein HKW66_Vig0080520 [Vigna angularis]
MWVFLLAPSSGLCFPRREECASHRATGSRVRVLETIIVLWYAGMKVSPVGTAEASADDASAPRFAE